uniref:Uncharacterized protein n=1 Tax=Rhipicephalus microplus TaxID=6941 RepID=A0A6G5A0X7_RHIMP
MSILLSGMFFFTHTPSFTFLVGSEAGFTLQTDVYYAISHEYHDSFTHLKANFEHYRQWQQWLRKESVQNRTWSRKLSSLANSEATSNHMPTSAPWILGSQFQRNGYFQNFSIKPRWYSWNARNNHVCLVALETDKRTFLRWATKFQALLKPKLAPTNPFMSSL